MHDFVGNIATSAIVPGFRIHIGSTALRLPTAAPLGTTGDLDESEQPSRERPGCIANAADANISPGHCRSP